MCFRLHYFRCIFSFEMKFVSKTLSALKAFLEEDSRKSILEESLKKSFIVLTEDMEQAYGFAQEIAPEHLEIMVSNIQEAKKKKTFVFILVIIALEIIVPKIKTAVQ